MDARILTALRCPVSASSLELHVIDADRVHDRELIRTGILFSRQSRHWYPIVNYVPVLLTFSTRLSDRFRADYDAAFGSLAGYRAPSLQPMPGETSVQKTFTEEWAGLGDDETTFIYSDAELLALHRDVWL